MINVMIADELIENEQTEVHPAKKKKQKHNPIWPYSDCWIHAIYAMCRSIGYPKVGGPRSHCFGLPMI